MRQSTVSRRVGAHRRLRRRHSSASRRLVLASTLLLASPHLGGAALHPWVGSTGSWDDDTNWSNGIPDQGDVALINNGGTAQLNGSFAELIRIELGSLRNGVGTSGAIENGGTVQVTNLWIGKDNPGSYLQRPSSMTQASDVRVGYDSTGTFTQQSGTTTITGSLQLGLVVGGPSASGTFLLNNGTLKLSAATANATTFLGIGEGGSASFVQSGGTLTSSGAGTIQFRVGDASAGTYQLIGGKIILPTEEIGDGDAGTFTQSGGGNTTGSLSIFGGAYLLSGGTVTATSTLVYSSGATLQVSGSGVLAAANLLNNGSYTQTGGTNSSGVTNSPAGSHYTLSGGVTGALYGFDCRGDFEFPTTGTLNVNGIGNLGAANFTVAGTNGAITVAPNSLLILPPGVDPNTRFTSFTNNGMVHNAGSTLTIPAGATVNGTGVIEDPVTVAGTLSGAGGPITLPNVLTVSSGGVVNLGGGTLNVNNLSSSVAAGGSLTAGSVVVGVTSPGALTVDGSLTTTSALVVGHGATGSVVLNNASTSIGGPFGGVVAGDTSPGTVRMTAGTLGGVTVGNSTTGGMFIQDGGTVNGATVGANTNSAGTYVLNAGTFNFGNAVSLTRFGKSTFIQNGGVSNFTGIYQVAFFGNSSGSFFLNGGTANFNNIDIGNTGAPSRFTQTGGTVNATSIVDLRDPGIFEYGGGGFTCAIFQVEAVSSSPSMIFDIDSTAPFTPLTPSIISVGGKFFVDLKAGSPLPSPSDTFVLIDANTGISGTFSNALNGSRIGTDGGTFRVNYGFASPFPADQLVLSDFQVPEPSGILAGGIAAASFTMRRRRKSD